MQAIIRKVGDDLVYDTIRLEDYWKVVEDDDELKRIAEEPYYKLIAGAVEKITGERDDIVKRYKEILDTARKESPETGGIFRNGQFIPLFALPRKKGHFDDLFVYQKIQK